MPGPKTTALRQQVRELMNACTERDVTGYVAARMGINRHAAAVLVGKVMTEDYARRLEALREGGSLREGQHDGRADVRKPTD